MAEGPRQSGGPPRKKRKAASGEDRQEPKLTVDEEKNKQPLLFFFHVGTTGRNISQDHIVELSGKVICIGDPCPHATQPTFNSLVYTSHPFNPEASRMTGITATTIRDESPFPVVFHKFLDWITQEVSGQTGSWYPVLVAHCGFRFDFPLLLAEIERGPIPLTTTVTQVFSKVNCHFADTYSHVKKKQKHGHPTLQDLVHFGLKDLYEHLKIDTPYQANRAFLYVETMERVFTHSGMVDLLLSLPHQNALEYLENRNKQKKKGMHAKQTVDRDDSLLGDFTSAEVTSVAKGKD